jgi:hypothetical protein
MKKILTTPKSSIKTHLKSYLVTTAFTALAIGAIGTSPNAAAVTVTVDCSGQCATESTLAAVDRTVYKILTALGQIKNVLEFKVVGAIQGNATSITTSAAENAKLMSEANVKNTQEFTKADLERKAVPLDPCSVTALAKGGREAVNTRPVGSGRGGSSGGGAPSAGGSKEMVESLAISSGSKPAPSPEIAAALSAKGACATFAQGGVRAQSCTDAGFSTGVSSGFPNADIRAETLFDGPQSVSTTNAGVVARKLTLPPGNSPERLAVAAFIRNLETPVDLRTLKKTEIDSEAGRNYIALRDSYDAAISMASKPLRDQESMMTANKLTLPILKQLLKGEDKNFITTYLNKAYPKWATDGVSIAELLQLEAARRYLNEDWHARMAAANEKQIAAEQVQLMASQNWMTAMILERQQQQAILQGTTTGAAIRQEKMPQLIAAHKAAKL